MTDTEKVPGVAPEPAAPARRLMPALPRLGPGSAKISTLQPLVTLHSIGAIRYKARGLTSPLGNLSTAPRSVPERVCLLSTSAVGLGAQAHACQFGVDTDRWETTRRGNASRG